MTNRLLQKTFSDSPCEMTDDEANASACDWKSDLLSFCPGYFGDSMIGFSISAVVITGQISF